MILYYTLTKYQQLGAILHKQLYELNEDAHLYVSNGNYIDKGYIERLEKAGFFTKVVIFDDQTAFAKGAQIGFRNEEKLYDILDEITKICERSLIMPINQYDNIYILADHFPLGYVCAHNNIPYHYMEEAASVHCCYELWKKKLLEQKNEFLYLVAKNVGVYGSADCVIDCWVDIDKQGEGYSNNKAIDFSIPKLLKRIDRYNLNKILEIFNLKEYKLLNKKKGVALILTEYLAHAKVCTWQEQRMIYAMLIDYFSEELQLFIKPHPNDHQGIYSIWFPDAVVLNKDAPSELIPYCITKKIDILMSICSTSFKSLEHYTHNVYSFRNKDLRTEKLFRYMNKYFVASQIIRGIGDKFDIYGIGADVNQVRFFLKNAGYEENIFHEQDSLDIPKNGNQKRIFVIDSLFYTEGICRDDIYHLLNDSDEKDIFIFIDSNMDILFYDDISNFWAEYTVPIKIEEKSIDDELESKEGWIFVYTKDYNVLRECLEIKINKILKNTGMEVVVNDSNRSIRERMLEGMLYATEQKCNLLIHRK